MGGRRRPRAPAPTTDWLTAAEALAPAAALEPVGSPVDPSRVEPIEVRAHILGRIAMPNGPLAIDGLLASAVCLRAGLTAPVRVEDLRPVEIPVAKEPGGRFHLASFSVGRFERFGPRWVNRRFPIAEAQALAGPQLRRIPISGGPCKSYRIPLEAGHVEGDVLTWYVLGDGEAIRDLLGLIDHLGKRRGVGLGRVLRWDVEPCDLWGDGFPVVSPEGKPLRTLPLDWPGLVEPETGFRTRTFPYWRREAEELSAVVTRST
jgi:hypothetical protein